MTPIYEQFPAVADAIRAWAGSRGLEVEFSDHCGDDFIRNTFSAMIRAPHLVMTEGPGAGRAYYLIIANIDPRGDAPAATARMLADEWDRGLATYGVVPRGRWEPGKPADPAFLARECPIHGPRSIREAMASDRPE